MADTPISITQTQIFTLLRAFFLLLVDGATVEIVQGQGNRVPMPEGDNFVIITPGKSTQMATPVASYDSDAQTMSIAQSTEIRISVDCYGPLSGNLARVFTMALRSSYACDQMPGIAPLYADDAVQFPLVDGEQQFEERWRFDSVLHYTPAISVPQQSALEVTIGVISVDATYPP